MSHRLLEPYLKARYMCVCICVCVCVCVCVYNREGNGIPLQYSCLKNPMDGGAWWAAVHGVAKSRTRLSDFTFTFTFHFHALEKEMATHSSVLAWRIPGMGEPGGLPSMGVSQSRTRLKRLSSSSSSIIYIYIKIHFLLFNYAKKGNMDHLFLISSSLVEKTLHYLYT